MSTADPARFRALMGRWATGVSVVTAEERGQPYGLTVNAFLSVSLHPPTLLVSLSNDADTTPVIARTGRFAVNLLAHDQRALSELFAKALPGPEKFRELKVLPGREGVPLLEGTLGSLECRLVQAVPAADHQLLLGEVETIAEGRDELPLLFFRSRYGETDAPERLRLPPP
ncbi:MAG: flavin reductase family protein [Thermoplasmata archaeon]|nr:flavin reductase family protein [Thermoplasmata archaeon]